MPTDILRSRLTYTMFWLVRLCLSSSQPRILIFNFCWGLLIDLLEFIFKFVVLGSIEFHFSSARATFWIYNYWRNPKIDLLKLELGFITNSSKDKEITSKMCLCINVTMIGPIGCLIIVKAPRQMFHRRNNQSQTRTVTRCLGSWNDKEVTRWLAF